MYFHTLLFSIGLFAVTSSALSQAPTISLPSPTSLSPSHATASSQISSYFSALATALPFSSALFYLSSNTTASSSLSAFEASLSSVFVNRETLASDYLNGIPEPVRPFFSSVYAAEASILKSNGLGTPLTKEPARSTGTGAGNGKGVEGEAKSESKKAAASREAGLRNGARVAVVGAVGFVCLVAAL